MHARRSLVFLLKALAESYGVVLALSPESSDAQIKTAVRKVSLKGHPQTKRAQNKTKRTKSKYLSFGCVPNHTLRSRVVHAQEQMRNCHIGHLGNYRPFWPPDGHPRY